MRAAAIALLLAALTGGAAAQPVFGSWRVVSMSGERALPAEAEAFFDLRPGAISGRAFCNRFAAAFEREGPEIAVKQPATTRMACPEPLMALERTFLSILGAAASATVGADGVLTIRAADGRTVTARPI